HLHPEEAAACASCERVTCRCPAGIDIPRSLIALHRDMVALHDDGVLSRADDKGADGGPTRVVRQDVPSRLACGAGGTCRLYLETRCPSPWLPAGTPGAVRVELRARRRWWSLAAAHLREAVPPGGRGHFALEFTSPSRRGRHEFSLVLIDPMRSERGERETVT